MYGNNYRVSSTNCAVPGCHNTYSNTDKIVKFYSFPGRPHEKERRQTWISNIKRYSFKESGCKLWEPAKFSRICSVHFVGNAKSNHPLSPSYNPTVFTAHQTSRFNRLQIIREKVTSSEIENDEALQSASKAGDCEMKIGSVSVSCQCKFDSPKTARLNFESTFYPGNETATQCKIENETSVTNDEKYVGPDDS